MAFSLPHMLDQGTVGLQFSYNLKRFSKYLCIQISYFVRNDSWTRRIECVKLIFNLDRKKRKAKRKKDSFDLANGVPQTIQFTCDKLSPLLSRSVPYNKFEYINIEKIALK